MILVFGKNGQVAKELQILGKVITCDRNKADLLNPLACAQLIRDYRPSSVINAAAYTAVDKAESEPKIVTITNAHAPSAMAQTCAEIGIPFIHISTDYVFSGHGQTPWKPTDITIPQNTYGLSKLAGEKAIIASGANYAIIRTSWIFSAHGVNFVKTLLSLSRTQKKLSIISDQVGGPTPAHDIAATCLSIVSQLEKNPRKFGIYHFSGKPFVSWHDFATSIFKYLEYKIQLKATLKKNYQTAAKRPLNSRMDCSQIRKVFGISQPDWHVGLKNILKEIEVNS